MIQRYFIVRGPFYSSTHKYVCLRNDFLYVVRVHSFRIAHCLPWVICSISVFRITPAYHCITILNTLRLSRVPVVYPFPLPPSQHIP
jgi:hypothetical protein